MAMAPPAKSSFVFMHYSNPAEDSKRIENRQKVAKYAMLGRQKNASSQTTKKPSQRPQQSRRTQSPEQPTTTTTTTTTPKTDGDWTHVERIVKNTRTRNPSSLPDLTGSVSTLSDHSTSPALSHASPEYWPSPPHNSELQTTYRPPVHRYDSKFDHGIDAQGQDFSHLADCGLVGFDLPSLPVQSHLAPRSRQPTAQNSGNETRLANRREQARRKHEHVKLLHQKAMDEEDVKDDSLMPYVSQQLPTTGRARNSPRPYPNPRELLSASPSDPFSCLPIKANAHTHELLYQYMNARLISSVYANGSPETFERIKTMRHTVWSPLTMKSKAALNALVAYVESTPGLCIKSRSKDFLFSHVAAALESIREALSRPDVATDDSICFAVVLLMLTAQREGSTETYARHAAGLATLLGYRSQAIHRHGEQADTVKRLMQFHTSNPADECTYCRSNGSPSRSTSPPAFQEAFGVDAQSFNEAYYPRGEGFRDLIRKGLLTENMKTFIEPAMIWSTLAERARRDKLSAAIGATHAWIDEGEFSLANVSYPLDSAVFSAVRTCFYLSSWLDWQHSCHAVRRLGRAIYAAIHATDIEFLLLECPNLLIWLCLMTGPICEGEQRSWFMALLVRARNMLSLDVLDFHGRIEVFTQTYVWSATMTPMAQDLWNESCFDPSEELGMISGRFQEVY